MASALVMVMSQDGSPHNGHVCIRPCKIAWKSLDNGQESLKGLAANGHGNMLAIEENAVFIEVGIRGILKAPIMTVHIKANNPVISPSWMV